MMQLPSELRRQIFWENFADRDTTFHPSCGLTNLAFEAKRKDPLRKIDKRAHNIPNLMTINRTICEEMTEVVYEERTFVIHVHEGLKTGGVEILNVGRQPLQYQDCTEDKRFSKFEDGKDFGLQSMRKIIIQILPTTEDQDRHLALNTHFMNLALCRLLERPGDEKRRITSISIEFAAREASAIDVTSRTAIFRHEKPWVDLNGPKQSSVHNVSDIELALRPFGMLTACHSASVKLPPYLDSDPALTEFVANLVNSMQSKTGTLRANDVLERHVETLRPELEEHVRALYYGNGIRQYVAKLTDKDMFDEGGEVDTDIRSDNEYDGGRDEAVAYGTHSMSMRSRNKHAGDTSLRTEPAKRRKMASHTETAKGSRSSLLDDPVLEMMDEDDQLQQVLQLSLGLPVEGNDDWRFEVARMLAKGYITKEAYLEMVGENGQNRSSNTLSAALTSTDRIRAELDAQLAVVRENEAMGEDDDVDPNDMRFVLTKMVANGEISKEKYVEIMSANDYVADSAAPSRSGISDGTAFGTRTATRAYGRGLSSASNSYGFGWNAFRTANAPPRPRKQSFVTTFTSEDALSDGGPDAMDVDSSTGTDAGISALFDPNSVLQGPARTPNYQASAATGSVSFGHHGPGLPGMTARAAMLAEDSGVGMLASDDGRIQQAKEEKEESATDEKWDGMIKGMIEESSK